LIFWSVRWVLSTFHRLLRNSFVAGAVRDVLLFISLMDVWQLKYVVFVVNACCIYVLDDSFFWVEMRLGLVVVVLVGMSKPQ